MKNILFTLLTFFILMNCKEAEIKPEPFSSSSFYGTWSYDSFLAFDGRPLNPEGEAEWRSYNLKLIFENYNDDTLKLREENWATETNFPRSSLWIVKQSQNNETHYASPLTDFGYGGGDTEKEYSFLSSPLDISLQENYLLLYLFMEYPCEGEECTFDICCYNLIRFKKE